MLPLIRRQPYLGLLLVLLGLPCRLSMVLVLALVSSHHQKLQP
jgi:hypothetical protein